MEKDSPDFLLEWATWARLSAITDLELILLKGHLMIETIVGFVLKRNGFENDEKLSFFGKILAIEKLSLDNTKEKKLVIYYLKQINSLRNKLAHEFTFNPNNGELEKCSEEILNNLVGTKYGNYTYRTRIVHSFSVLAINTLKLDN